jgi:hypothetical protein
MTFDQSPLVVLHQLAEDEAAGRVEIALDLHGNGKL